MKNPPSVPARYGRIITQHFLCTTGKASPLSLPIQKINICIASVGKRLGKLEASILFGNSNAAPRAWDWQSYYVTEIIPSVFGNLFCLC